MTIIIYCATATCANTLHIGPDDPTVKDWQCPVCADHDLEQQVRALAAAARPDWPGLGRPINKFSDF